MNSSWFIALQEEACLFLKMHPMIFLLVATLPLLFLHMFYSYRNGSKFVVNWPVVGMLLPTIVANHNRLLDHAVDVLGDPGYTFMFKGPWFSGMNFLVTCHPENAKHMFNTHFSNYTKGDGFTDIFDVLGDGIISADGESWAFQRRMAHARMGHPRFRNMVGDCTRDKVATVLLPLLNHMAEFDKVVDLSDVLLRFTYDTTCTLALNVDPGCLALEFPSIPFAEATHHFENVLLFRHIVPMTWWKCMRLMRVGKEKKTTEAAEIIDQFIAKCIQEKRKSLEINKKSSCTKEGPIDLLTSYMDLSVEDAGECSNIFQSAEKFLRDTVFTLLAAGKDSTGVALVWFFWLVTNNSNVEKKILEELRKLRPSIESKKMTIFDPEEIDKMIYLHAALCETLRLYPSTPFTSRVALKDDVLPSGHKIKAGMKIIFFLHGMGRMEGIWGEDCLEFKPERWITENGTLIQVPSYKFVAFHSGPRSCLGKSMAFIQLKMVVAAILYNFSIELVEGYVAEPQISMMLHSKNGLPAKLKKRELI